MTSRHRIRIPVLLSIVVVSVVLHSCASLMDAVKAREALDNCNYELKAVKLKTLDIAPIIVFDNSSKKVNIEAPSVTDLIALADQIANKQFSLTFSELTFDAILEIDNPNNHEVIVDSLFFDCFLDESFMMKVGHYEHNVVPAVQKSNTTLTVHVPTDFPYQQIIDAQDVVAKGKIWLRLSLIDQIDVTLPVPVSVRKEIPREEIYAMIDKEKDRIVQDLLEKAKEDAPIDKIKEGLDSIFN